ncbi:hypothetical protein D1AOALGA4SA_12638 [Olavius algarvensis Delta 1 endosymbiont]|nr:hypothetical protein D1AOALGA4SA_12638 [Olavius algarvensis Delta 1 endosymbiont]
MNICGVAALRFFKMDPSQTDLKSSIFNLQSAIFNSYVIAKISIKIS